MYKLYDKYRTSSNIFVSLGKAHYIRNIIMVPLPVPYMYLPCVVCTYNYLWQVMRDFNNFIYKAPDSSYRISEGPRFIQTHIQGSHSYQLVYDMCIYV